MANLETQRLLTMDDALRIIERGENLPFYVDNKLQDKFKKDIAYYEGFLRAEADKIIGTKPWIDGFDEIMVKLQKLSFISPSEQIIEKSKRNYYFIIDCLKIYPPPRPKSFMSPVKAPGSE